MEINEILETYSGKKVIRDENLDNELKSLYSLALEYREKELLTGEMIFATEAELKEIDGKIGKLKSIGLGKSKNVRRLEEELENKKETNSKMQININRTKFLAKIADKLKEQDMPGFLVMGYQDFAKFLVGKNYSHKALADYEGELSDEDIEAVENLVFVLGSLSNELTGVINVMRTTRGAGQFKDEKYKYGALISIEKLVHDSDESVGKEILEDNRLYFIDKNGFLRPEGVTNVSDLLDNDLYQVRFDDGWPNHDLGNLFDSSLDEEEMWISGNQLGVQDLLIADSGKDNSGIIYQTYLDGVIIYRIIGQNLKFIDYGTVRMDK